MPETPRGGAPPAAGRPALRLFAWVLLATLALDGATTLFAGAPVVPVITALGRWVIGLAAGFVGMRHTRRFARTVAAAFAGMVLATLLTDVVYVLTGRAAADLDGPAVVLGLLLGCTAIALLAPIVGTLGSLAVGRPRRA